MTRKIKGICCYCKHFERRDGDMYLCNEKSKTMSANTAVTRLGNCADWRPAPFVAIENEGNSRIANNWTTEPPTEPGWYWLIPNDGIDDRPRACHIWFNNYMNQLYISYSGYGGDPSAYSTEDMTTVAILCCKLPNAVWLKIDEPTLSESEVNDAKNQI